MGHQISKRNNGGFTLIEVLIYSALLAFIMTAMLGSVYMIIQAYNQTGSTVIVNDEANFILRKMNWAISCATSVTVPAAGATSAALKLSRNNIPISQNPLSFNLVNNYIVLTRGAPAVSVASISSSNVEISNLTFQRTSVGEPDKIKIDFTLNGNQFESSKYIRKCI